MTIATYTELQAAVIAWTHRDGDTAYAALVPDFIRLAEARFNRQLRTKGMETALASTALVSGALTLPAGFLAFKELRSDGDSDYTLQPATLEWLRDQPSTSGRPTKFAVTNTEVVCNGAGSIVGTYYKEIPALASNATNWLLTSHPDLFASLEESGLYTMDEERSRLWAARANYLLEQVQSSDIGNQLNGGPLTARAR